MQIKWNDAIIADSEATIVVEGNHYFPPESVNKAYLLESDKHTTCPWKGLASYYSIKVGDEIKENAAWYYPKPNEAAKEITGYIAFYPL